MDFDPKLIDRRALRAAIRAGRLPDYTELEAKAKGWLVRAQALRAIPDAVAGKWSGPTGSYWSVDTASLLCSLTAHCRGRLHATEKWIPLCDATGGREKVVRTMDDQLKLLGNVWKLFLKSEPMKQLLEEEKVNVPGWLS
jgi:hypothetical protein